MNTGRVSFARHNPRSKVLEFPEFDVHSQSSIFVDVGKNINNCVRERLIGTEQYSLWAAEAKFRAEKLRCFSLQWSWIPKKCCAVGNLQLVCLCFCFEDCAPGIVREGAFGMWQGWDAGLRVITSPVLPLL